MIKEAVLMKKSMWLPIGIVAVLCSLLTACSAPSAPSIATTTAAKSPAAATSAATKDTPQKGGVLKLAISVGLSSALGYPAESGNDALAYGRPIFESLITVRGGGVAAGLLATSWDIDPTAKTMTFHLRKGVKFTDGTDFNAQAVKWNYDLIMAAKRAPNFKSVEVMDDSTVRINLNSYQNTDLTGMAAGAFGIISPTNVQKNGLEYARSHPVGPGPYKFVEYIRDSKLVYTRNESYWDAGKPYLDGIEWNVVPEETVRKMMLQRGDIHRLTAAGITAQELQKTASYTMKTCPGGTFILAPDSKNTTSPLSNLKVRQAISYAIDRETFAKALGFGFLTPAYQVYPGFREAVIPNLQKAEYNPDKAKQLLKDAGYPSGIKVTMYTYSRLVSKDFTTALSKMLGDAGIQIDVQFPETGKYEEYRTKGWSNAVLAHAMQNTENLNMCFKQYFTDIQMPSVGIPDGYQDAANASLNSPEVNPAKLQAAFKIINDNLMVIPYAEEVIAAFYRDGVHDPGADEGLIQNMVYKDVWLEPKVR
jgi:peptide/nickel transport system substrate-binding protein